MAIVEGIAVSGEYIVKLDEKTFVVAKAPHYDELPNFDNPEKLDRKLVMTVKLSDGSILDYYPNKTSVKTMANLWGYEMDAWIGRKFEWTLVNQNVMGQMKDVVFVKPEKFEVKEVVVNEEGK